MKYFAYGSNLNLYAVADWCRHYGLRTPALRKPQPAILDNYRMGFPIYSEYWGGGIADIAYDPGKYVCGVLFDVQDRDLETLDRKVDRRIDGHGREIGTYARIEVNCRHTGGGPEGSAWTYAGVDPARFDVPPTENYVDSLVQGCYEGGLTSMWIEYLRSFGTQPGKQPRPPVRQFE